MINKFLVDEKSSHYALNSAIFGSELSRIVAYIDCSPRYRFTNSQSDLIVVDYVGFSHNANFYPTLDVWFTHAEFTEIASMIVLGPCLSPDKKARNIASSG